MTTAYTGVNGGSFPNTITGPAAGELVTGASVGLVAQSAANQDKHLFDIKGNLAGGNAWTGAQTEAGLFTCNGGLVANTLNVSGTSALAAITSAGGIAVSTGSSTFKELISAEVPDAYSATISPDWNTGNNHSVTLTGNITINSSNQTDGGIYTMMVIQDGVGSHTISWGGDYNFGLLSNVPKATAGSLTLWMFRCYVNVLYATSRNEF
jgi:hypothetical protein